MFIVVVLSHAHDCVVLLLRFDRFNDAFQHVAQHIDEIYKVCLVHELAKLANLTVFVHVMYFWIQHT